MRRHVTASQRTLRLQAKFGPLTADHPAVARVGTAEPLPTWPEFSARVNAAKKLTVRDVWGLMLTSLPGARTLPRSIGRASGRACAAAGAALHGQGCCWGQSAATQLAVQPPIPLLCAALPYEAYAVGCLAADALEQCSQITTTDLAAGPAPLCQLCCWKHLRLACLAATALGAAALLLVPKQKRTEAGQGYVSPTPYAGAGVGPELAEAVLRAFATPRALWRAYAAALAAAAAAGQPAAPAAAAVLAGLPVSAHRKVSPAQAAKVFGGLFVCGWAAAAPG